MQANIKISPATAQKWREIGRKLKELGGATAVRVGILEGATTPDGTQIALYAAVNEFGGNGHPARSFMRSTADEKGGEWADLLTRVCKGNMLDQSAARRALTAVGRIAMSDIQAKIMSNIPPANSPEYAELKKKKHGGYSGTLFLTGAMHKAVNFEVVNGDGKTA